MNFFRFLIFFILISCVKNKSLTLEQVGNEVIDSTAFTIKNKLRFDVLKGDIKLQLEGVSSFELLQENIDSLNRGTISSIKNTIKSISEDSKELFKKLPEGLNNSAIKSRVNQINTYSQLIEFQLSKKNGSINDTTINRLLYSYNSLIIQLNESNNGISEGFKKELEKSKFERDSLNQQEKPLF